MHHRKKHKIDLWEITGCAQIQAIESPAGFMAVFSQQRSNAAQQLLNGICSVS
jgi:hypothetical protein